MGKNDRLMKPAGCGKRLTLSVLLIMSIASCYFTAPQCFAYPGENGDYTWDGGTGNFWDTKWRKGTSPAPGPIPASGVRAFAEGDVTIDFTEGVLSDSLFSFNQGATIHMSGGEMQVNYQPSGVSHFLLSGGSASFCPFLHRGDTFTQTGGNLWTGYCGLSGPLEYGEKLTITGGTAMFSDGLYNENGEVSIGGNATVSFIGPESAGGGLTTSYLGSTNLSDFAQVSCVNCNQSCGIVTKGALHITGSSVNISTDSMRFVVGAEYTAPPGTTVKVTKDLQTEGWYSPTNYVSGGGLENTHFIAVPSDVCWVWVSGEDRGCVAEGFENNHAIGTLSVEGEGTPIVNINYRQDRALYVRELHIPSNAEVKYSGKLYYSKLTIEPGGKLSVEGFGETCQVDLPDEYTLTVAVEPKGAGRITGTGIDCPGDCSEVFDTSEDVTLTATAGAGYVFDSWQGSTTGRDGSVTVTMDGNKSVKAVFKRPPPPNKGKTGEIGDPVNTATGEYYFSLPAFDLGGPLPLSFSLYYGSGAYRNETIETSFGGTMGYNWLHNFNLRRLDSDADHTDILFYDGEILAFSGSEAGGWELSASNDIPYQLKTDGTGNYYLLNPVTELVYVFNTALLLDRIMDRHGNTLTCSYDEHDLLVRVSDNLDRSLIFTYTDGKLSSVCDGQDRCVSFSYSAGGLLTGLTDPAGHVTHVEYDAGNVHPGLITRMILPRGNSPHTQTYDAQGQVVIQTDADSNATSLNFSSGGISVVSYPDGSGMEHTHVNQEFLTGYKDQAGHEISLAYDEAGRRTGLTDRLGGQTQIAYDTASGKETAVTNTLGDQISFSYTQHSISFDSVSFDFSDLTRIDYPDGTFEQLSRDDRGNVLTRMDRQERVWQSTYNSRGQTLTVVNPAGGTTTYAYSENGNLTSFHTSDASPVVYTYNRYNQLERITAEDGRFIQYTYNPVNWLLSMIDQRGNTTKYGYDENGNVISVTDPEGNSTLLSYDDNDRLIQATDRSANQVLFTYDSMNRVQTVTQADGNVTTFFYTPQGWTERIRDAAGREVKRAYDAEGMPVSLTTPLGHQVTFFYDALGRLVRTADPSGNETVTIYDSAGRVTRVTDPSGSEMSYTYDEAGLLKTVTMLAAGLITVERDLLGNVIGLTDFNGKKWRAAYSTMGNLSSYTDPLENQITYTYDTMGRLTGTAYPTGETVKIQYDPAGNIIQKDYSSGLQFINTYDSSNRLLTTNDLQFSYDADGRIVATTDTSSGSSPVSFGALYDTTGRLNAVTYNNDLFTVNYSYDQPGRLTQVADTLTGNAIQFEYDADSRLVAIQRPNGVHSSLEWNETSRVTRLTEGAFMDMRYTLDPVGRVTRADLTLPLDPSTFVTENQRNWEYDNASQVATNGYKYDANGRLTASPLDTFVWDAADRLIETTGTTMAYNGLDDLIAREAGGVATHYYYNHAIDMTPPVAERLQNGDFTRYYIWSPAGMLLYSIDAGTGHNVSFYHFDREGNTQALTDSAGQVTDTYAYTPYGQLAGHNGSNSQPFTFVGKFGVRQEGKSGTLYHMRSRYYDAVTGRFLSRDSLCPDLLSPLELNPYCYAMLNPVGFSDPGGTGPKTEAVKSLWKELGDLWGLVKPTKTQLVGNVYNGTVENFMPGGAELKQARKNRSSVADSVANMTGGAMVSVTIGAFTDAVTIPTGVLGNILKSGLRPEKEEVYETLIVRVMGNIKDSLARMTPAEREAYLKFLKKTAPHLVSAVTREPGFTPAQIWNGPIDSSGTRPPGCMFLGNGMIAKAGLEAQLMLLESGNLAADRTSSTLAGILAWPFRKIGNFSSNVGHVIGAAIYGKKGATMDELLYRFPVNLNNSVRPSDYSNRSGNLMFR